MCRLITAVGLCDHILIDEAVWEPADPRDCPEAMLEHQRFGGQNFVPIHRCPDTVIIRDPVRKVCDEPVCWVQVMLQQEWGWTCCLCSSLNAKGRFTCTIVCMHAACTRCKPN